MKRYISISRYICTAIARSGTTGGSHSSSSAMSSTTSAQSVVGTVFLVTTICNFTLKKYTELFAFLQTELF